MKTCKAKKMYGLAIMLFSIMLVSPTYAQNGPKGTLRVGAAKVDITPNQDELPRILSVSLTIFIAELL